MADGKVEYDVRASLDNIDSDLDAANKKVTAAAEKGAKKQEELSRKSQDKIKEVVKKSNDDIESDSRKTQESITKTVEKESGEVVKEHEKATEKVVKNHKIATEKIETTTASLGKKVGAGLAKAVGMGLAAAGGLVVAVGTAAIDTANSLDRATNQLTASLGLTADEAKKYENIIKSIYGKNYGDGFEDIADKIGLIKQSLSGISDSDLQQAVESAYLLNDVYNIDIAESIKGANSLVKNFGISAVEAYNLMAQGAEKGLNQNGDLADQLAEYSTYYADMGFRADEAMSMLVEGAKTGVYQIDYLNDAFKEFSIRVKDGSQTTSDGLALLGLDAKKLAEDFAAGGEKAYQAYQLVNEKLAACEDDVARNSAGVALYGTKWEDLGEDAVLAMTHIGDSIDHTRDKLSEMESVKFSSLSDMFEALTRTVELLLLPLGNSLIPILSECINVLTPICEELLPEISEAITPIITDLALFISPLVTLIKEILPQAVALLSPIIDAVSRITKSLVPTLIKLTEKLLPPIIKIVDRLLPPLVEIIDSLLPILDIAIDLISPILDLLTELADPLSVLLRSVAQLTTSLLDLILKVLEPLMPVIQGVADVLTVVLGSSLNLISGLVSNLASVFSGLVAFLSGDIMRGLQQLGAGFVDLFSGVLGAIDSMFGISLQKWYNETAEACRKIGADMYAATHQDEIEANKLHTKYNSLHGEMNDHIVKALRDGKSVEEAISSAKDTFLTDAEKSYYFDTQLSDLISSDTVSEWQKNILANNGLYSQGYEDDTSLSSFDPAQWYSWDNQKRLAESHSTAPVMSDGYKYDTGVPYSPLQFDAEKYKYTPSGFNSGEYSYTPSAFNAEDYAYNFSDKNKSNNNSVSDKNKPQTVNITSYVPTVWDDAKTSNKKLADSIGYSNVGNSKTGKIISDVSSVATIANVSSEKPDATLNDVVEEIKNLKIAQEKMQYTLDVTLKTSEYTLAKATVKGIKLIKKQTGKNPI